MFIIFFYTGWKHGTIEFKQAISENFKKSLLATTKLISSIIYPWTWLGMTCPIFSKSCSQNIGNEHIFQEVRHDDFFNGSTNLCLLRIRWHQFLILPRLTMLHCQNEVHNVYFVYLKVVGVAIICLF